MLPRSPACSTVIEDFRRQLLVLRAVRFRLLSHNPAQQHRGDRSVSVLLRELQPHVAVNVLQGHVAASLREGLGAVGLAIVAGDVEGAPAVLAHRIDDDAPLQQRV